jgi:8-oxo-dGTP pyrophosphatase MutT (NUDIX family)
MSPSKSKSLPISINPTQKRMARAQFGALCYRIEDGELQVLLITSRRTKRWIVPKGWPENGLTPAQSAANEAREEAGVTGKVKQRPIGTYSYEKNMENAQTLPCIVTVYALKVTKQYDSYTEQSERRRKWFGRKKAASLVADPELARLIKAFAP